MRLLTMVPALAFWPQAFHLAVAAPSPAVPESGTDLGVFKDLNFEEVEVIRLNIEDFQNLNQTVGPPKFVAPLP